jgi:hypothetical protein
MKELGPDGMPGATEQAKTRREFRRKEKGVLGLYVAAKAATHKDGPQEDGFLLGHFVPAPTPRISGGRAYALNIVFSGLENFMKIEIVHCPT